MNAERTTRIFKWWMKANRKVAFYEEESRQKQKAIDPWNVQHINHPDNIGSEDWCKWNQWSMRSEILRAKLENRPANHWHNCAMSNDECERRNALARERFDAKQPKPLVLPRPCTVEGYHIDEAYLVEVPSGRKWDQDECAFAADEVIDALKAAGIPFTIKE